MKNKKILYAVLAVGVAIGAGVGINQLTKDEPKQEEVKDVKKDENIQDKNSTIVLGEPGSPKDGKKEEHQAEDNNLPDDGDLILKEDLPITITPQNGEKEGEPISAIIKKPNGDSASMEIIVPSIAPDEKQVIPEGAFKATLTSKGEVEKGKHQFIYELKNTHNKDLSLTFNTTQRIDYVVKDAKGNNVFQFSDGQVFNMLLQEEKIKSGKSYKEELIVSDLQKGKYTIHAWMTTSEGKRYEQSASFEVK